MSQNQGKGKKNKGNKGGGSKQESTAQADTAVEVQNTDQKLTSSGKKQPVVAALPTQEKKDSKSVKTEPATKIRSQQQSQAQEKNQSPGPVSRAPYGYPTPGQQRPTGQDVMDQVFFVPPYDWERIRDNLDDKPEFKFDAIVIGTGFCGLGFVDKALKNDPFCKILMLERGPFFLPAHFQNLPLPYASTLGGLSETFPWTLSTKTAVVKPGEKDHFITYQHGMVPFFGGRSTLWSAWCPEPLENKEFNELDGWNPVVKADLQKYIPETKTLLAVIPADKIDEKEDASEKKADAELKKPAEKLRLNAKLQARATAVKSAMAKDPHKASPVGPVYDKLQEIVQGRLQQGLKKITGAQRTMAAPLAVDDLADNLLDFNKFSTPGPLLALVMKQKKLAEKKEEKALCTATLECKTKPLGAPLRILANCVVNRIIEQDGTATALDTSRGIIKIGDAKLILGAGTIPNATLVLNSFPNLVDNCRYAAHFITAIVARVPRACIEKDLKDKQKLGPLEMAAVYLGGASRAERKQVRGDGYTGQWHVQLTAIHDQDPTDDDAIALRRMPDVVATASPEQLKDSQEYVVFVCAVLGEADYSNKDNFVRKNNSADPTTNVLIQLVANDEDKKTWDSMDKATFEMLEKVLAEGSQVEYWSSPADGQPATWNTKRPDESERRVPGLVHESSTLHISEKDGDKGPDEGPVDTNYQLKGSSNVFVTGAALWPRSGSWNPTLAMTALARSLADKLVQKPAAEPEPLAN
jgi:choline dehydrogenase-like flavoprotein